jgi:hypothetical protein
MAVLRSPGSACERLLTGKQAIETFDKRLEMIL